ncbi:TPA: S26 family signal peptidase [Pseudomonas aeruginosa]|nr:S26 family signal peptidase [Pseudomonas aeruginosa]
MTACDTRGADTAGPSARRSRPRNRMALAITSAIGLAALAWASLGQPAVHIVYNPSDSVAVGWYRILPPEAFTVGGVVLVRPPAHAAAVAARRGYLPLGVPLLKRVGAVAPQHVCIEDGVVRIDGTPVAAVMRADWSGRPLSAWPLCRQLADGELFLLSATNPASFDSRYFGPIPASAVLGSAQPLYIPE